MVKLFTFFIRLYIVFLLNKLHCFKLPNLNFRSLIQINKIKKSDLTSKKEPIINYSMSQRDDEPGFEEKAKYNLKNNKKLSNNYHSPSLEILDSASEILKRTYQILKNDLIY